MNHRKKTSTSSGAPETTDRFENKVQKKPAQDGARAADESNQKIDRPGFDLSGSSDDTHAGTGLGLGENAFDKAGERRLPGRRLDNTLTIPRWGGPEPRATDEARSKLSVPKTPSAPHPKKGS